MTVAVEVIRKGEKARIDVLTIAKRIAAFAPGLIIECVDGGRDIRDRPFAPYSPNYRAALALAAEPPSPEFGLAPNPNPTRVRYGLPVTFDPRDEDPTALFSALADAVAALAAEANTDAVTVKP